jgi:DNA-binding winged helix-turn-helix (wHTH) protein
VIYQFGRFTLNSDARTLLADQAEVHLSPKAFTLLLMLIEHRQRVMTKQELQERLWPSTFIGETNLSTLVAEVRRALGETAQQGTWLRTTHRIGYRFVGTAAETTAVTPTADGRMYVTTPDRQFPLIEGMTTIGRGSDAAIRVDAGGVSRHHARILVCNGVATIEDLGSKNGTFVGDAQVAGARPLADGDRIRLGPVLITFHVAPATVATETMIEHPPTLQDPS